MHYSNMGGISYSASHIINYSFTEHSVDVRLSANSFLLRMRYIFEGKENRNEVVD